MSFVNTETVADGNGRTGTRSTNDPRAEKTRQSIFDAVETIMTDSSAVVSVSDVVRVADISRSTFYAHFASLDELASAFIQEQFAKIGDISTEQRPAGHSASPISAMDAARVGYGRLVEHMVEHYPLYSSVLELPLTRSAYDEIVDAYASRLLESIIVLDYVPAGVNPSLVATYAAGGAVALISSWMRGLIDVSDDDLVDQLVSLLPQWLLETRA
jgi:AcrR family transcriptional regulator